MKLHLRATGYHLQHGITQFYLPPNISKHTLPDVCNYASSSTISSKLIRLTDGIEQVKQK